jgi:hypothetical protein
MALDDSHDQKIIQGIINLLDCMIDYDEKYTIKVAVTCHDSGGSPDMFFCQIHATLDEIEDGKHLQAAQNAASNSGYQGPFVIIDEDDKIFNTLNFCAPKNWLYYNLDGQIIEENTSAFNYHEMA